MENDLKVNGSHGDFIIYRKEGDRKFPVRICYLQETLGGRALKKLQIKQSEDGLFSLLSTSEQNALLFNSVSELVDGCKEPYRHLLKTPFLGLNEIWYDIVS